MLFAVKRRLLTPRTPRVPESCDDNGLRRGLYDEFGIELLGGFGPLRGKILRVNY